MKEKETTNAMSCPTKSPEASARRKMILSGVIFLVLVVAVVTYVIIRRLVHSRAGRAMIALRENEPLANEAGTPRNGIGFAFGGSQNGWTL